MSRRGGCVGGFVVLFAVGWWTACFLDLVWLLGEWKGGAYAKLLYGHARCPPKDRTGS